MAIRIALLIVSVLLSNTTAFAQNSIVIRDESGVVRTTGELGSALDGSVRIKVRDNLGNIPPDGTECTLTERQQQITVSALSKGGEVTFEGVVAGEYMLTVFGAPVQVVAPKP